MCSLQKGRRYIEAVLANESEAMLLGIERGAPLVMLDSISFSEDGNLIEYYHALHRGDRSRFEVELSGRGNLLKRRWRADKILQSPRRLHGMNSLTIGDDNAKEDT